MRQELVSKLPWVCLNHMRLDLTFVEVSLGIKNWHHSREQVQFPGIGNLATTFDEHKIVEDLACHLVNPQREIHVPYEQKCPVVRM